MCKCSGKALIFTVANLGDASVFFFVDLKGLL